MEKILGFMLLLTGAMTAQEPAMRMVLTDTYQEVVPGETVFFLLEINNSGTQSAALRHELWSPDGHQLLKRQQVAMEQGILCNITVPQTKGGTYQLRSVLAGPSRTLEASRDIVVNTSTSIRLIEESLFDIIVDIPDAYRTVEAGAEVLASIKLINVGSKGRIDVFLEYRMIDPDGNEIFSKRETVAVETQANFVRRFDVPSDTKDGRHRLYAKLIYADGKFADSEHSFQVNKDNSPLYASIAGIALTAGILLTVAVVRLRPAVREAMVRRQVSRIVRRKLSNK